MSYSFQRTYLLKQQTPLIHFQYDQEGATLRASEVKPKLDRYLIRRFHDEHPGEEISDSWWINPEKDKKTKKVIVPALNYRIIIHIPENARKIVSNQSDPKIEAHKEKILSEQANNQQDAELHGRKASNLDKTARAEINGMYFGNMVNETEKDSNGNDVMISAEIYEQKVKESFKETVFYNDLCEMKIICKIESLRSYIDNNIESFFVLYNFGCRQTKGFGGFLLTGKKDEPSWPPTDPLSIMSASGLPFFWFSIDTEDYEQKLNIASAVYAIMKGGVNRTRKRGGRIDPTAYVKGYIQRQYLNDRALYNTGSEKAKMKAEVIRPDNQERYNDYLFVRALLGLPDYYEFKDPPEKRPHQRKGRVNVTSIVSDEKTEEKIERFHSPVTIKICGHYVFFWFGDVENILGKWFSLSFGETEKTIQTPEPKSIDWKFFIKHFKAYFDSEKVKTGSGMIKCGYPFANEERDGRIIKPGAVSIDLVNGCDNK